MANYRRISLIPTIGKIMESCVNIMWTFYLWVQFESNQKIFSSNLIKWNTCPQFLITLQLLSGRKITLSKYIPKNNTSLSYLQKTFCTPSTWKPSKEKKTHFRALKRIFTTLFRQTHTKKGHPCCASN